MDTAGHALGVTFSKHAGIPKLIHKTTGKEIEFIDWFNTELAGKDAWKDRPRRQAAFPPEVYLRFRQICNQIPEIFGAERINLAQFVSLISIFLNEVGPDLLPMTERVGTKDHPGIAYAFNKIPGIKISYNQAPSKTAFALFNDKKYIAAHGHLPLADRLKNTTDERWNGMAYPVADFPTSTDPAISGFILEADFYKFRGRGFIQTTWRSNYVELIKFVQAYAGTNSTILRYQVKWAGLPPDDVATLSTNADWDDLFQNTDLIIPCAAMRLHNKASGNYLALSTNLDAIIGESNGSIFRMGLKISGGKDYANLFRNRVIQTLLRFKQQVQVV